MCYLLRGEINKEINIRSYWKNAKIDEILNKQDDSKLWVSKFIA